MTGTSPSFTAVNLPKGGALVLLDEPWADAFFRLVDQDRVAICQFDDFVNRWVRTPDEARKVIQYHLRLAGRGESLPLGILHHGQLAGRAVAKLQPAERTAELSYMVAPPFQRQGIATDAMTCIVAYLFAHGYEYVWLSCDPENVASVRVAEKLGMKPSGTIPPHSPRGDGTYADHWVVYSITNQDWEDRRAT